MDHASLEARVHEELAAESPLIALAIDRLTAITIIGNLQLALRHPANHRPSVEIVLEFIRRLDERLPPALREAVALGFDPRHDVPKEIDRGH